MVKVFIVEGIEMVSGPKVDSDRPVMVTISSIFLCLKGGGQHFSPLL